MFDNTRRNLGVGLNTPTAPANNNLSQHVDTGVGASPVNPMGNNLAPRVMGRFHQGGTVPKDGLYELKAGEKVIPAPEQEGLYCRSCGGSEKNGRCSKFPKRNRGDYRQGEGWRS
jgi:hypothetical protein